jgi:starch synthase (maltosyl-transferring)
MSEPTSNGRLRVVIARLSPEIDCGRFAAKRVIGEKVIVEADVFTDGHDQVACRLVYWQDGNEPQVSPMKPLGNDRWRGEFCVAKLGRYTYTVEGWVDHFQTWRRDLEKRISAKQDISVDLLIGAGLIEATSTRAKGKDSEILRDWARRLRENKQPESQPALALDTELLGLVQLYPERELVTRYDKQLPVVVDREKAAFSSWYEVFPRSCSPEQNRHGTFRDCEQWLPYIASMGFDVLYLPPIHPIGRTFRKGKNNTLPAGPGDVGSPWAIGGRRP